MLVKIAAYVATLIALASAANAGDLLDSRPRPSYENVKDINAIAAALCHSLDSKDTYSFSRGWWTWDRLRCR